MDKYSPEQRSLIMSKIKGKNTKPEIIIFEALEKLGLKFERHFKLLGNPDIVFPDKKVVIFIDGDFWHGWNFNKRQLTLPDYWIKKISRNIKRDKSYRKALYKEGWNILRLWEHRILKDPKACVKRILKRLEANQ